MRDHTPIFGPETAYGILLDITAEIEAAVKRTPPGRMHVCNLVTGQHDVDALRWVIAAIEREYVKAES